MKILALIDVAADAPMDKIRGELAHELMGSWSMYTSGVLREAYATGSPTRVVFVLEAADIDAAKARMGELPLVASGVMHVEYVELRPFANWALLFK